MVSIQEGIPGLKGGSGSATWWELFVLKKRRELKKGPNHEERGD